MTEEKIYELHRECKITMEVLEGLEELRGREDVNAEELEAAIAETEAKLEGLENQIIRATWKS